MGVVRDWQRDLLRAGLAGALLVAALFVTLKILRTYSDWPTSESDNVLLIGILILGVLPPLGVLFGAVVAEKGSIKTKWFEVDLKSAGAVDVLTSFVPANIGEPTGSIADSGSNNILDGLRAAALHRVAVIDLAEGNAWWETRLFVLAAGAERIGSPELLVFVATGQGPRDFVGSARPQAIRQALTQPGHDRGSVYSDCLHKSRTAAAGWREAYREYGAAQMPGIPADIAPLGDPYTDTWVARPELEPGPILEEQMLGKALGQELEDDWLDPAGAAEPFILTPSSLKDLLGATLSQVTVAANADPQTLAKSFATSTSDWLVETDDNSQFTRVLSTAELGAALLRVLVQERLADRRSETKT